MENKKKPERMCSVCRKKGSKDSFVRIVKNKEGIVCLDKSYKLNGRGMYICNDADCIHKAIKSRAVNRVFKIDADENIYKVLEELL